MANATTFLTIGMMISTVGKAITHALNHDTIQTNIKLFIKPKFATTNTPEMTNDINSVTRSEKSKNSYFLFITLYLPS